LGKVFEALKKAGHDKSADRRNVPGKKVHKDIGSVAAEPVMPVAELVERKRRHVRVLDSGDWDERLTIASLLNASVMEQFRTLRTRILHPAEGVPPRTVLVTSATPGEGKSFVCANLGISFAQGVDHHGLLVDADLRKPTLAKLFGHPNDFGLVNYLRDMENLEELITGTGVDTLSILPAGPPPVNPAELLGSESMASLILELGTRYEDRVVIFDSPPLHAAAETVILAKHVDAVVLVVRWGTSRREHVQALVERIGPKKIIGVVFNAYRSTLVDNKVFGEYEYQRYSYEEK
jgi:exopolysaccharide/PEP-CTERM locus tyrosine autokinase